MFKKFIIRWLFTTLGLASAAYLLEGVNFDGSAMVIVVAALLFSVINSLIRPVIIILTLPAIILTLGLFTFIVNGLMLYLTAALYDPFSFANFWVAVATAIIVSLVNYVLNLIWED